MKQTYTPPQKKQVTPELAPELTVMPQPLRCTDCNCKTVHYFVRFSGIMIRKKLFTCGVCGRVRTL
jgi:hypothetical protein